jgi:hypothetical protein
MAGFPTSELNCQPSPSHDKPADLPPGSGRELSSSSPSILTSVPDHLPNRIPPIGYRHQLWLGQTLFFGVVLPTQLVWFRQDLRIRDQKALVEAAAEGAVLPVYILDDEIPGQDRIGAAQRWWLHESAAESPLVGRKIRVDSGPIFRQIVSWQGIEIFS